MNTDEVKERLDASRLPEPARKALHQMVDLFATVDGFFRGSERCLFEWHLGALDGVQDRFVSCYDSGRLEWCLANVGRGVEAGKLPPGQEGDLRKSLESASGPDHHWHGAEKFPSTYMEWHLEHGRWTELLERLRILLDKA